MRGAARVALCLALLSAATTLARCASAAPAEPFALALRGDAVTPVPVLVAEGGASPAAASPRRSAPAWSVLEDPGPKGPPSPTTARNASIAATTIPLVVGGVLAASGHDGVGGTIMGYGVYLGPAAGWWYADHNARGWAGIGTRVVITLATAVAGAVVVGFGQVEAASPTLEDPRERHAWIVATGGAIALASSAVWDIVSVERVVRRDNARRAAMSP